MKTKTRKKVKLSDLSAKDMQLLRNSFSMKQDEWFCFGYAFERLHSLSLVSEDNKITYYGKKLVEHLQEF